MNCQFYMITFDLIFNAICIPYTFRKVKLRLWYATMWYTPVDDTPLCDASHLMIRHYVIHLHLIRHYVIHPTWWYATMWYTPIDDTPLCDTPMIRHITVRLWYTPLDDTPLCDKSPLDDTPLCDAPHLIPHYVIQPHLMIRHYVIHPTICFMWHPLWNNCSRSRAGTFLKRLLLCHKTFSTSYT